jgi:predicted transcriptional regulator YheO
LERPGITHSAHVGTGLILFFPGLYGCICINFDVSDFVFLSKAFSEFNPLNPAVNGFASDHPKAHYAKNFAETMESVIDCVFEVREN